MPPKKPSSSTTTAPKKSPSGLTRIYLFLYNLISFGLWASCTLRTALLLAQNLQQHDNNKNTLSTIFAQVFPLLAITQSLAALEILHSLIGLVRAPVLTTAMQVASRFLVVWGVMYAFHEGSDYISAAAAAGAGILGSDATTQYGDYAFLGCMFAWGVTECIRYGFFAMLLAGLAVPGFWLWLRYNTFFVLYPIGISSECILMYLGLEPAERFVSEYYKWFLVAMLGVYVPGSYILYTHMMAQRRKIMRGKSRVD